MNKKLFITSLLFVFFMSCNLFGEIRPDSVLSALHSSQSDSAKLNLIFRFSNQKIRTDSTFEINLARELESFVRTTRDKSLVPEGFRLAANLYLHRNRFEKALSLLNEALDSAKRTDDPKTYNELAKIYLDRGAIFYSNGDFQSALPDYIEAEHYFEEAGDIAGLIQAYANLGDLYDKILQPEKRKNYNQKAFDLITKTSDQHAVARAYTGMATNLIDDKKYEEALDYYLKVVQTAKALNDKRLEGTAE